MPNMYNIEAIHPFLLHHLETKITKEIVDECKKRHKDDPVGVFNTNVLGWQSQPFVDGSNDILADLINSILKQTIEVYTRVPTLGNYWVSINKPNSHNDVHDHPKSHISGIIFVQIPKDSGFLHFPNPNYFQMCEEIDHSRPELKQGYGTLITPEVGKVLIFPSCLHHGVTRNITKKNRITLAFNAHFD